MSSSSAHEHAPIENIPTDIAATDGARPEGLLTSEGQIEEFSRDGKGVLKDTVVEYQIEDENIHEDEAYDEDESILENEVEVAVPDDDMAQWAGQPHIKGSTESVRMALLTFGLIGLQ
jgi:hypothetical protein